MLKKVFVFILAGAIAVAGAGYWHFAKRPSAAALAESYLTPDDQFLDIAGARVRVRVEGPEDAPPIILLHGFIYSLESWDAWAADLRKDYRVIRFDLLGHGLTGPDPQHRYSPDERAAFLNDVMDALGIEKSIIVGNSLGGLAAWKFAATHPDRVSDLVLVSPGAYPVNGVEDTPLSPPPPMALFLRTAPDAGIAAALKGIYADANMVTPEKVKLVGAMMRNPGNGEAFVQSIEEFTLPDPTALLNKIAAPTLIIWGAEDRVIPVEDGRRLDVDIPNAELIVYEHVGHVAQEEAAERTLADLRAFLSRSEPLN